MLPNSDKNLRCVVNCTDPSTKSIQQFSQISTAAFVTDLVWKGSTKPKSDDGAIRRALAVCGIEPGTYISGARIDDPQKQYPNGTVLGSDANPAYADRVDIAHEWIRNHFADAIIAEVNPRPGACVFIDNIRHPSSGTGSPEWEHTCALLGRIRAGCNKPIIANVAGSPVFWHGTEYQDISDCVDGLAFEQPFHEKERDKNRATNWVIDAYSYWLDHGKTVIFIPVPAEEATWLAAFAMMIRNPGHRLFISYPFHLPPPSWQEWTAKYGKPLYDYEIVGTTLRREFEGGILTVDVTTKEVK